MSLIGTTLEHPFFEAQSGWVQANELRPGDRIAILSGEWVRVEEVYDTGEWVVVYNLRIADHHTYFVCKEVWGFAVWAHNAFCAQTTADGYIIGSHSVLRNMQNVPANSEAHHIGQNAAMKTIQLTGSETYSPSTAPAIFLIGGSGQPGSPHDLATTKQRETNAILGRGSLVTVNQEAKKHVRR